MAEQYVMTKTLDNNGNDTTRSGPVLATVIIAAWRAESVIARSIGSALDQDAGPLEVIVADDASPDRTGDVVAAMMVDDPRIRYTRLDRNGGPGAARNAALDMARGDWIAVLDSDDQMMQGRLGNMIALAERVGADGVFDDLQPVDPGGVLLGASHLDGYAIAEPELWTLERFLAGCLARPGKPALGYLKPVLRRGFVQETGLRYDESLRNGEDFHLMAEFLAQGGALWFTPEAGYLYTRRAGSVSARMDPAHARALAHADAGFGQRHAARLSGEARRLLNLRQRNLDDLAGAERAISALRDRRLGTVASLLVRRPRTAIRFIRQVGAGLRRRLGI